MEWYIGSFSLVNAVGAGFLLGASNSDSEVWTILLRNIGKWIMFLPIIGRALNWW